MTDRTKLGRASEWGATTARAVLRCILALAACAPIAGRAAAITGGGPTGCIHLCPSAWQDYVNGVGSGPCVVTSEVNVIAGSVIDCGDLDVHITADNTGLTVTDGGFWLYARSVLVDGQGQHITAACSQYGDRHGFKLEVADDITVAGGGALLASCALGGGDIELIAGDAVTLGGAHAVKANGTGSGAPGGSVTIRADGGVFTTVPLEAKNTASSGSAGGGSIQVDGDDVTLNAALEATGTAADGGWIAVSADGDLSLDASGTVNASKEGGGEADGGQVTLEAVGSVTCSKQIKVKGSSAQGRGGTVEIVGEAISIGNNIIASGGAAGGEILAEARGGTVGLTSALLDVTRSSNNSGDGGAITLRSLGNDVTLSGSTTVDASGGGSSGVGGSVEIDGVGVSAAANSVVKADGGLSGSGGDLVVQARDTMTLSGSVHATNGGYLTLVYRAAAPVLGSGVDCTPASCDEAQDDSLPEPCGDGIRRAGVEGCDGSDLGEQSCESLGLGSGLIDCNADCTLDLTGCSGN